MVITMGGRSVGSVFSLEKVIPLFLMLNDSETIALPQKKGER